MSVSLAADEDPEFVDNGHFEDASSGDDSDPGDFAPTSPPKYSKKSPAVQSVMNADGSTSEYQITTQTSAETDPVVARITSFILRRRKAKAQYEDDGIDEAETYEGGTKKVILEQRVHPAQQLRERISGVVRCCFVFNIAMGVIFLSVFIQLMLYFGALWNPSTDELKVFLYNRDQGVGAFNLGQISENGLLVARNPLNGEQYLNFITKEDFDDDDPVDQFTDVNLDDDNDDNGPKDTVRKHDCWASIEFPKNLSMYYIKALYGPKGTPYDIKLRMFISQGRQYSTATTVETISTRLIRAISDKIAMQALVGTFGGPLNVSQANSSAVIQPLPVLVDHTTIVHKNGENYATFSTFNVIWTSCLLLIKAILVATNHLKRSLSIVSIAIIQTVAFLVAGTLIALETVFIAWGFGTDYTHNLIFAWMWITLCVWTFISIVLLLVRTIGDLSFLLLGIFLVLMITTSNALLHKDQMPGFYGAIGFLLPFYHAVEGLRFIVFGGNCCVRIFTFFGVLMGYFVVTTLLNLILWALNIQKQARKLSKPGTILGDTASVGGAQVTSIVGQPLPGI